MNQTIEQTNQTTSKTKEQILLDWQEKQRLSNLILSKATEILDKGERKAVVTYANETQKIVRLGRTGDGDPLIMLQGSHHKGTYLANSTDITDIRPIKKRDTDPAIKWEKQVKKLVKMLETSGLWGNVLAELQQALRIGYDTLKKAYDAERQHNASDSYEVAKAKKVEQVRAICPQLIVRRDGKDYIDTSIIWHYLDLRVKKMYFGKYENARRLAEITTALRNNTGRVFQVTAGYDVSFQYNPELRKAWYSEEYRNCGNGYYWLVLNNTHALFCEKD